MTEIARINDAFRARVFKSPQPDGKVAMTHGIATLGKLTAAYLCYLIESFNDFPEGNDPYGEHDFGVIMLKDGTKVYWKIDYYEDAEMEFGTEDKANAYRVLVIMLAEEY